jgi:hypothetical protein
LRCRRQNVFHCGFSSVSLAWAATPMLGYFDNTTI